MWTSTTALLAILGGVAVLPPRASAVTVGMVADNGNHSVTVFDADADTTNGTVFLPGGGTATGDCSILPDQTRGFVTDFEDRVWAIDLATPALAGPPNPIPIVNFGEDTSLSPDKKFLVVCDGSAAEPVSVVDVATQTEISTFPLGSDCDSVDVCDDGSVLVTSISNGTLRRLAIDGSGTLSDTGESLLVGQPVNVACAPGSTSGVAITTISIQSFTIPGLVPVDARAVGSPAIAGVVNAAGTRFYVRATGGLDAYTFTAATGALGAAPLFSIPLASANTFFGMEQLALHPNDTKLYVSNGGVVSVFDAGTGAPITTITDPNFSEPTGICFSIVTSVCGDGIVSGPEACDDGAANGTPASCCTTTCTGVCNDGNQCTNDVCDSSGGSFVCSHTDNTAPCTPADRCIVGATCSGGVCGGGSPKVCDDHNACTDDVCNHSTGGCFVVNNAAPCNDGNPCTDNDQCRFGGCQAGTFNANPCNDGNACTQNDHCQFGFCQGGGSVDCNDQNPCTTEFCQPFFGCVRTPLDGITCNDDNPCTTDDACRTGVCTGDERNCHDNDPCTVDTCNSAGGAFLCLHEDCTFVSGSSCPAQCQAIFCGNGRIDPGETCDPPDATPQPGRPGQVTCRLDCTSCGDAITQAGDGETCDDGNLTTGCNPLHPTQPLDACQTSCTPPICQDPARIRYANGMGILDVHGRIEPVAPAVTLAPVPQTFVVELTSADGLVLFRSSLEAGTLVARGRGFKYVNRAAKLNGGIGRLKFAPRGTSYRVTLTAYGNLTAATDLMTTHLFIGAQEWTLRGQWVPTKSGWQLDAHSALGAP